MKFFIITCLLALSGLTLAQTSTDDTSAKPATVAPTPETSDSMETDAQKEEEKKRLEEKEEADEMESGKTEESPDMGIQPSNQPSTVP